MRAMTFQPDPLQARVLAHERGVLLVTGAPGTGKTAVLREQFARLIEGGADPERVALVVATREAKERTRDVLLQRLGTSLPVVRALTVHGLAFHVMSLRYRALRYDEPPTVLSASEQFARVARMLATERRADWPVYAAMLDMRGFADQVRQFVLRAQEAMLTPEELLQRAEASELHPWRELALFYGRYLDGLAAERIVDFAGLLARAAEAAQAAEPTLDHLLVDDVQDATAASARLIESVSSTSLVVAGDAGSYVFAFQGKTDRPLRRLMEPSPARESVELLTNHRGPASAAAWVSTHVSEEVAAVARELRRTHVRDGVGWDEMAVIVRRTGSHVGGLLRALDEAGVPRAVPEDGVSLLAEPAAIPFMLALRWVARPQERDALVEPLLTSELARLSPAAARALVRAARADGASASGAIDRVDGLTAEEAAGVRSLAQALERAEPLAERSVLDCFRELWTGLEHAKRLVAAASSGSDEARRDLAGVLALAVAVASAGERADVSVGEFLRSIDAGDEGPGTAVPPRGRHLGAVRVLTAHGSAGLEFDTVVVVGAQEGSFPSLARNEPMFDLAALESRATQADRNRARLEDERRLFHVVRTRARRRTLFTATEPPGEEAGFTVRSRFVAELGVGWTPSPVVPGTEPVSVAEAVAVWRRSLADRDEHASRRLASLAGLMALHADPGGWWFQRDWTRSDRPPRDELRVSYSKLDTLENCALQFVLSEELGLEGAAGYHAWVGHLVHGLIEECERGDIERSEEALVAAAEASWRPQEFPSFAVSEAFRRSVTRVMLPAWFDEYGRTPALDQELHFEFPLEGATVSGYIDRVGSVLSGGSQITDYKTGRARTANVEDNLQLGIYYLAVNHAPELERFRPVKAVELAFLKDVRDGRIARAQLGLPARAQEEYASGMQDRVVGLIRRLEELEATGSYRPDPSANCRYCDFKPLCPLWPEGRELLAEPAEKAT